jgi:cell division protein FtsQ
MLRVPKSEVLSTWPGRIAISVVVAALVAAAAVSATYTPLFRLQTVSITGARHLSAEAVRRLAGVDRAVNVAHLDLRATERALEQDPRVAVATVTRDLPSTLLIDVVERHAIAAAPTEEGRRAVAADGTVLPDVDPSGLPEIRSAVGPLSDGGRASALSVLVAVPHELRGDVDALVVQPDGGLVVQIADGPMVEYGPATGVAAKGEAMRAVLGWAAEHDVVLGSIDVEAPAAPTARTRDGAPVQT